METLGSYFPGIIKKLTDSINLNKGNHDLIKFIRFEQADLVEESRVLCVLIGYELGFEVWAVVTEPELIFSKRNQGVSCVTFISKSNPPLLALSSLYPTSDFPLNSVQICSLTDGMQKTQISTEKPVINLESNPYILAVQMFEKISLYENTNFTLINTLNISNYDLTYTLSNLYIAFTIPQNQDSAEDLKITDVISKTMQNFAESSLGKIINYIDPGVSQLKGKIWVKNLMNNSLHCEIQAFNSYISTIKFSKSSHLLVAAVSSGTTFHVYRVNPAKEIKSENKSRFFLLYKLHRGITPAVITDISISEDDHYVSITSLRGTCHVYKINPYATSLIYNQEPLCRIKLGSILDSLIHSVSCLQKSSKDSCEVLILTLSGQFFKYSVDQNPSQVSYKQIFRNKNFKELPFVLPMLPAPKTGKFSINRVQEEPNWTPLMNSSQFSFYSTDDKYLEKTDFEVEVRPFSEEKTVPSFTVHYEGSSGLTEALNRRIPNTQLVKSVLDPQFIESSVPTYQLYLAENFYK